MTEISKEGPRVNLQNNARSKKRLRQNDNCSRRKEARKEEEEEKDHGFPRTLRAGNGYITAGCLQPTPATATEATFRANFARDGYLLIRGHLPRRQVKAARAKIVEDMTERGFVEKGSDDTKQGGQARISKPPEGCKEDVGDSPGLLQRQDLAGSPTVRAVLEHPKLKDLLQILFGRIAAQSSKDFENDKAKGAGQTAITPHPYKWLRAVPPGLNTGPHVDRVYFPNLQTIWIPLGDINTSLGSLVLVPGSHTSEAFSNFHATYGNSSVGKDGTQSGWCTDDVSQISTLFKIDENAMNWMTEDVRMGDVIVVDNRTLHMSATNVLDPPTWRISCDTRWFC
ncbi:hypothetical protein DFJ77DRAFT_446240 [Powellomyces hirtus]|nr:hypothetical protein DFJ77DRAFT_446240 [Powellomyces hirtus]